MKDFHREHPWKKPPPGWEVSNVLYTRLLVLAQRTNCKELINQVRALQHAPRSDLVLIMEAVSQAANGDCDPTTIDLQDLIDTQK